MSEQALEQALVKVLKQALEQALEQAVQKQEQALEQTLEEARMSKKKPSQELGQLSRLLQPAESSCTHYREHQCKSMTFLHLKMIISMLSREQCISSLTPWLRLLHIP